MYAQLISFQQKIQNICLSTGYVKLMPFTFKDDQHVYDNNDRMITKEQ